MGVDDNGQNRKIRSEIRGGSLLYSWLKQYIPRFIFPPKRSTIEYDKAYSATLQRSWQLPEPLPWIWKLKPSCEESFTLGLD